MPSNLYGNESFIDFLPAPSLVLSEMASPSKNWTHMTNISMSPVHMTFSCTNVDLFMPMMIMGMMCLYVFMHALNSMTRPLWRSKILFAFPLRKCLHHWMLTIIGLSYKATVWAYVIIWVFGRGYLHLFCVEP